MREDPQVVWESCMGHPGCRMDGGMVILGVCVLGVRIHRDRFVVAGRRVK